MVRRAQRPDRPAQQHRGNRFELRIAPVEIVGLLQRPRRAVVALEHGQDDRELHQRRGPDGRHGARLRLEHGPQQRHRGTHATHRDSTGSELDAQFTAQITVALIGTGAPQPGQRALSCLDLPAQPIQARGGEQVRDDVAGRATGLVGEQQREFGSAPAKLQRGLDQRGGVLAAGCGGAAEVLMRRAVHLPSRSRRTRHVKAGDQSRVSLRCVTRCGLAASAPILSTLFCS
jgi:hypothetical protein